MTELVCVNVEMPNRFIAFLNIARTRFTDCRVHDKCACDEWAYCRLTGQDWPGIGSNEWIEYIPEGDTL